MNGPSLPVIFRQPSINIHLYPSRMISYTVVIASSGKRDLISFFCLNLAPHLPFPSFVPLAFTTRLAVLEEWAVIRLWSPAVPDLP